MGKKSPFRAWHRLYRNVYRANHALTTARAFGSGDPQRVARLYERRWLYRMFARLLRKVV